MGALLLLLLASPQLEVSELPAPEPSSPRASLYCSPFATGGMLTLGAVGPGGLYVPTGGVLSLGPHWGITAELSAGVPFLFGGRMMTPGWSFAAAAGPTWFLRDEGTDGFFVTSKLQLQVSKPMTGLPVPVNAGNGEPLPLSDDTAYTFLVGLDFGYQWHLKKLTLATLLGGSVGYGYHRSQPWVTALDWGGRSRGANGLAYAINLDLLRVGYAF